MSAIQPPTGEAHARTPESNDGDLFDLPFPQFLGRILAAYNKPFSKDDMKVAVEQVKDRYYSLILRQEGPCLLCGEEIQYVQPSSVMHKKSGDQWLDEVEAKFKRYRKLRRAFRVTPTPDGKYWDKCEGHTESSIGPYVCWDCDQKLDQLAVECHQENLRREESERQRQQELAELERKKVFGEVKCDPWERWQLMSKGISEDAAAKLQALPYKQFLATIYWVVVRDVCLAAAKYKCSLCAKKGQLNVHHRTYEHHGYEHKNLHDLTVLCSACHAKFHDKLPAPPGEVTVDAI